MSHIPSLKAHERPITALEGRVGDIETNHGKTLYELIRFKVKTDLQMSRMMRHFNIETVTEEEVDEVLDQE